MSYSNVTFVTHLRFDHNDRVRNLQTILTYYSNNFKGSKFIFIEDDKEHNTAFDSVKWPKNTSFYFIKNEGLYYRTRALNYGVKLATTPIVVSLDTDCIVSVESFDRCIKELLKDFTIAWPYNGYFIDVTDKIHNSFIEAGYNFNSIIEQLPNIETLQLGHVYGDFSVRCTNEKYRGAGGIVMFNKDRFLEIGGYNEKFISWGGEDNEIEKRCDTLEHKKIRDESLNAICFHLSHQNALRHAHMYYTSNCNEEQYVASLNKKELEEYISTWNTK